MTTKSLNPLKPNVSVKYRKPNEQDLPFIYSTWLKSYRQTDWAKNMSNDTFFHHHKAIVKSILENKRTQVTLICDLDDPDHLFGYVVAEVIGQRALVHFVYMKYNYRKLGIISQTLKILGYFDPKQVNFITHLPRNYLSLKTKYNLDFNPYLLGEIN